MPANCEELATICASAIIAHMEMENDGVLSGLAIFPLSVVLFPGALLPLHIFEERYKAMMRYAIEGDRVFGLSYCEDAAVGKQIVPELDSVGCLARINLVVPLEGGRMNILSSGVIRYRVREYKQTSPFLIAKVETFIDDVEPDADLTRLYSDARELAEKFLEAARALDEDDIAVSDIPEDPEAFSLLISSALPINNRAKQNLLEMTSTRFRLTRLMHYLIAASTSYNQRLRFRETARRNGRG
jgi:Lon protease-like protein